VNVEVIQRVVVLVATEQPEPITFVCIAASIVSTLTLHIGLTCDSR